MTVGAVTGAHLNGSAWTWLSSASVAAGADVWDDPGATMRTLSSEITIIQKFGVPLAMFTGLSLVAFEAIRTHAPVPVFVILTAGIVYAWLLIRRRSFPLKRVVATQGGLLVSNLIEEIAIPYSQIADVYMECPSRHSTVTIVLKAPSRFGLHFDFIPQFHFPPWLPHPVLAFIRERMTS